jgi:hypothetical protein
LDPSKLPASSLVFVRNTSFHIVGTRVVCPNALYKFSSLEIARKPFELAGKRKNAQVYTREFEYLFFQALFRLANAAGVLRRLILTVSPKDKAAASFLAELQVENDLYGWAYISEISSQTYAQNASNGLLRCRQHVV